MSIQTKTADATWGREEFELFQNAGDLHSDGKLFPYLDQAFDVRDDGAYLNMDKLDPLGVLGKDEVEALDWTPQCDLPNGNPLASPALPFLFNASQLAAFMLDGIGWFMQQSALDQKAMDEAFGGHQKKSARDALAAAIQAMDTADSAVSERPEDENQYVEWRRKMVLALLPPAAAPEQIPESEPQQVPEQAVAQVAPECGASDAAAEPTPQQSTAQTAPVTITRRALIDAYKDEWDGIYNDLNNAGRNGLSAAAKSSTGQRWNGQEALEWARRNGRLSKKKSGIPTSVFHLTAR